MGCSGSCVLQPDNLLINEMKKLLKGSEGSELNTSVNKYSERSEASLCGLEKL